MAIGKTTHIHFLMSFLHVLWSGSIPRGQPIFITASTSVFVQTVSCTTQGGESGTGIRIVEQMKDMSCHRTRRVRSKQWSLRFNGATSRRYGEQRTFLIQMIPTEIIYI